jgi:hypothetical protein
MPMSLDLCNLLNRRRFVRLYRQMDQKTHRVIGLAREVHVVSLKMYYKYIFTADPCTRP